MQNQWYFEKCIFLQVIGGGHSAWIVDYVLQNAGFIVILRQQYYVILQRDMN
jgi:hypothetical protein